MLRYIILGLILAGLFQVFFWMTQDNSVTLKQNASEKFESLSYAPFDGYDKKVLSPEQIRRDIDILLKYTCCYPHTFLFLNSLIITETRQIENIFYY